MGFPGRAEALLSGVAFLGLNAGPLAAAERLLAAPGGLAVVEARVGSHRVEMLVDTGSTATLIEPALARALGLAPVDRVVLTTPAGTRTLPRAILPALEVDGRVVEGLRVIVGDLPGLAETGRRLRGVLGLDALSRFDLALDFERRELALDAGCAPPRPEVAARVDFEEHRGVVLETRGHPGARPWRLLLDSGASGLVLFGTAAADAGGAHGAEAGAWRVSAADASRVASGTRVARLAVGGLVLEDVPAALFDEASERGVDGLLPASLFSSVCLSRAGGFVVLGSPAVHVAPTPRGG